MDAGSGLGAGRFEFVDAVTSDLAFVARAPTLEALFAAAAEALLAATVENPAAVRAQERRPLVLEEPDLELLLLAFLNELVFLRDAHQLLLRPERLVLRRDGGGARLEADLAGEPLERGRHELAGEVKAATAHGLRVAPADGGWEARVTFDV